MNKTFIAIGIIVIIAVLAFVLLRKPAAAPTTPDTESSEGSSSTESETGTMTQGETPTEAPENYSYTNEKFNFAVALPGLVVTERASADPIMRPTIFTFGVGDQSNVPEEKRIPNTMAVYVWQNPTEFELLMSQMTPIATETIRGREFSVYEITEGERPSYRYATNRGGMTYDVGVWNRSDINKFFLLD